MNMFDFFTFPLFFLVFLFGLIFGSFLNCLIWRLYKEETIMGRSYCPKCRKEIKWYDNVPVLSFLWLKGKCRFCHGKISWQYPIIEILTGVFFLLAFYFNFSNNFSLIKLLFDFILISILIIIFVFDWRWFLIPVQVLIVGAVILFGLNLLLGFSLWQILLSTVIGTGFFALQYLITRGKGLGEGDIWLGGFLGIAFPLLSHIITTIFLTYIIGGFVAIILLVFGLKKIGSRLPLGIFLSVSAIIVLFWANNIVDWYLGLIL